MSGDEGGRWHIFFLEVPMDLTAGDENKEQQVGTANGR